MRAEDTAIPALQTLKSRSEFLAIRGGVRASCASFLIEGRRRPLGNARLKADTVRFGFTVTKKLGNAVTRNRIRRRLKAAIAAVADENAEPGFDYVVIARPAAFDRPYDALLDDISKAFNALRAKSGAAHKAKVHEGANRAQPDESGSP